MTAHRIVLEGGPEDGREYDMPGTTPSLTVRVPVPAAPLWKHQHAADMTAATVPTTSLTYALLIGPGGRPARSRSGAIRYRLEGTS